MSLNIFTAAPVILDRSPSLFHKGRPDNAKSERSAGYQILVQSGVAPQGGYLFRILVIASS